MSTPTRFKRLAFVALGVVTLVVPLVANLHVAGAVPVFADPAFQRVWERTDKPVQDHVVARSWMWGPDNFYTSYEPYAEGPGGQHLVSYFDKSRMEINNPAGDRNAEFFVTNGLLVVDMVSGSIQVGNNTFLPATPSNVPVAGDTSTSVNAPTYGALANVASLHNDRRAPVRVGQNVREGLGRNGNVGIVDNLAGFSRYAVYEPTLGHNIPDVFWGFMNQKGPVWVNGRYVNDTVVDWVFAMGYPITEPYWINIHVGNQDRWVLMQAFQRRILTYSPFNPEGFKVEMGNVGRAYYDWRYKQPTPTPTPIPAAQGVALNPAEGGVLTKITVTGAHFPPYAAVTLSAENPSAHYSRGISTVAADANGAFTTLITLPADAASLGDVTVLATANGGTLRATASYHLKYNAVLTTALTSVVVNGFVPVHGEVFPPNSSFKVGVIFPSADVEWLTYGTTDATGKFNTNVSIGNRPVGSRFNVIAYVLGGYQALAANKITVLRQPSLQISPTSGPIGTSVTMRGTGWQPKQRILIGIRPADSGATDQLGYLATTDSSGNFTVVVKVPGQYSRQSDIYMVATASDIGARLEARFHITR